MLVIENVLADHQPDARADILDVIMLATAGGKERTEPQLADLFDGAGFQGSREPQLPARCASWRPQPPERPLREVEERFLMRKVHFSF